MTSQAFCPAYYVLPMRRQGSSSPGREVLPLVLTHRWLEPSPQTARSPHSESYFRRGNLNRQQGFHILCGLEESFLWPPAPSRWWMGWGAGLAPSQMAGKIEPLECQAVLTVRRMRGPGLWCSPQAHCFYESSSPVPGSKESNWLYQAPAALLHPRYSFHFTSEERGSKREVTFLGSHSQKAADAHPNLDLSSARAQPFATVPLCLLARPSEQVILLSPIILPAVGIWVPLVKWSAKHWAKLWGRKLELWEGK